MAETIETRAFERGIKPVLDIVLRDRAAAILQLSADATLEERIEQLATKSTEGELTESEKLEYTGYVRANKFVAILQRHARHALQSSSASDVVGAN